MEREILYRLGRHHGTNMSLAWIAEEFGARRNRKGGYSRKAWKTYTAIGATLQKLKRAGKVKYVGGKGAGWSLA